MLRALFFSLGCFVAMCGLVLFQVDAVVLQPSATAAESPGWLGSPTSSPGARREVNPPDWMAYTFASTGLVTTLYALAFPRRS